MKSKWDGFPIYDRPLGKQTEGTDDGRPVITITDFSKCTPSDKVCIRPTMGCWQVVEYETDEFSGKLLHAKRDAPAADITLKLNVEGWYAVYVWLMGGDVDLEQHYPGDHDSIYPQTNGPAFKLSKDKGFSGMFRTLFQDQMMWRGLEACFWRYEDLTGQDLTIRHQGATVYVGAVQLVPLSPTEVEEIKRDRADKSSKRLIMKSDTCNDAQMEVRLEHFRNRDIGGWIMGSPGADNPLPQHLVDTYEMMDRTAKELGFEWYVCDRPCQWSSYTSIKAKEIELYNLHPEWHCLDRDGTHTHVCSYAHPEVQDHALERVRGIAGAGPDGFGFFFNRDPGLILFEPVAMKGFEEKYGVDPCTLSDRDDRLLDWRADILTGFVRRVRKTLDEVAEKKGLKRIKMVHVVLGSKEANRFYSLDVETWVKEGLIDIMLPYPWVDYPDRWLAQGFVDIDVNYFASLVKGTECKLYPMWLTGMWRSGWTNENIRMNEYFTKAIEDYENGADGISTWDEMGDQMVFPFKADRWLRLGHKDKLVEWSEDDFPLPKKLRFTNYAGVTPDRYPAGTGG